MKKVLQISTCGMKNISKSITIDFANSTIEDGIKKVNNVKGIFGFNGAGKTAFITSVDLYKKIATNPNYLLQNDSTKKLDKLLNHNLKCFSFSIVFEYQKNVVLKHTIKIEKDKIINSYVITFEEISLSSGRTLNDKYKALISKNNETVKILDDERITGEDLKFIVDEKLQYTSIVSKILERLSKRIDESNESKPAFSVAEKILVSLCLDINNLSIYLSDADSHTNFLIDKKFLEELLKDVEFIKTKKDSWKDIYVDEMIVPKRQYQSYVNDNRKLEKFIKLFKPEVNRIELVESDDGDSYHVRRNFVYKNYKVELEFESSGIKQLVKLFTYLLKCSNGGIVFIDEIDTNINTVYFEKLILFFKKYGKGQLVFTTHNIEAMNALKDQSRSILALGENNNIDIWVGKGNRSPIKDYIDGYFPNSPMNIEDFDFVNVFLGED